MGIHKKMLPNKLYVRTQTRTHACLRLYCIVLDLSYSLLNNNKNGTEKNICRLLNVFIYPKSAHCNVPKYTVLCISLVLAHCPSKITPLIPLVIEYFPVEINGIDNSGLFQNSF